MGKSSGDKRKRAVEEEDVDDLDARLVAHGEQFMQMFEPTAVDTRRTVKPKDDDYDDYDDVTDVSSEESGGKDNTITSSEEDGDWNDSADAAVEDIFGSATFLEGRKKAAKVVRASAARVAAAPTAAASEEVERLEKKRFMSHKAGIVAGAVPLAMNSTQRSRTDVDTGVGALTKEEFQKLKREVHHYGAVALDKKSKKQFEAAVLQELGAKKEKGLKMPVNMAMGMAKKRAKREAVALEEAIAAGMVKRKGLGKKKRAFEKKASGVDRGLMEDGGSFQGGVLKVAKFSGGGGGYNRGAYKKKGGKLSC